jgi:alkanesulfonate monooxygenase SsuD/methylene tetrahydromethanopterin reductase-like flavin-dependent oxidoreductase (luciferase family)
MLRRRTDVHWREFSALGTPQEVAAKIDQFIAAGATKFVARPACPPEMMMQQLEILGREIVPRYHKVKV